jgi:SAM-dependent methyltransferase
MATYDPEFVKAHYAAYAEKEWGRWDQNLVERTKLGVHLHYLRKAVEGADSILEMGAGAGRFTQELARLGKRVVVADLSPVQLDLNRENAARHGFADAVEDWVECDMCNLGSRFEPGAFDAVVCIGGPLSYVFDEAPRAISELSRVAREGGSLMFEVMSLWGTVHQFMPDILSIEDEINQAIVSTGDLVPGLKPEINHYCRLYRSTAFRKLLEDAGLEVEVMAASNALMTAWEEKLSSAIEEGSEDIRPALLEIEIEAVREPGCLDMGTHLMAICRKAAGYRKK